MQNTLNWHASKKYTKEEIDGLGAAKENYIKTVKHRMAKKFLDDILEKEIDKFEMQITMEEKFIHDETEFIKIILKGKLLYNDEK